MTQVVPTRLWLFYPVPNSWLTTLTFWATTLVKVGPIGSIDEAAVRARDFVRVLSMIGARNSSVAFAALAIPIDEADQGRFSIPILPGPTVAFRHYPSS